MPGKTYPKTKIKNASKTANIGCPTMINNMTPNQDIVLNLILYRVVRFVHLVQMMLWLQTMLLLLY